MVESESSWGIALYHWELSGSAASFTHERYFNAFIEPCTKLLKDWPCKLVAYVLMPDHIHMIVNPKDGKIIEFTAKLKGLCAKALVNASPPSRFRVDGLGSHQVWQESLRQFRYGVRG